MGLFLYNTQKNRCFLRSCVIPQCQSGPWLLYLYFLFTMICFAWLNIHTLGSFPNDSLHILLINGCEYWWGGACASVSLLVCFLWVQREESISKNHAGGKVWIIYAVSQPCYNSKAINLQCNWEQMLRVFYFLSMVI